jgi:hypothetical protein
MDYKLENLGEDHFQQLCQSLLIKEFANVQCFPIRQPDGGRDSVVYTFQDYNARSFLVFQVKYVRKPLAEKDPHNWLIDILAGEKEKIRDLIPKGASKYVLITNIPGTAHSESGSIDRANEILKSVLTLPFECWWRDDINRRLDNAYDLKWQYPQLMGGMDMLRFVLENSLQENAQRRTNAVRTFVRAQYEDDKEVRFKQVELQNDLLKLFVDVPLGFKRGCDEGSAYYLRTLFKHQGTDSNEIGHAANLLLNYNYSERFPQIVLEGAPGQGKSTIAQFICQVRRLQILDEISVLSTLPDGCKPTSFAIPIKVDLRDFATWLSKRDPFSSEEKPAPPAQWAKSLEAFICALIRHKSGGSEFTVSDLQEISRLSSFLIVLDGLDEVADFNRRKEVISEITDGVARLRTLSAVLQVVITSRPTAFGPALGFNEGKFPHFELLSLSQELISEYANKWLMAKRLKPGDAANVRKILRQKIEQRHLRDLTRNPMQLTILLSLIHTKGSALPEKRTALYDGYVELFFNRESEKSEIVREHRDLLIDLHRYLAWVLHSQAETNQERGSITSEQLHKLLKSYLRSEYRSESSITDLFKGMVERVVFLISRVEGILEFEVQTLREYFAARHLYETAPYSPTGSEKKGTKPDRFDVIARNPYWLNVTRFFCGCFSKGELSCLADRLEILADKEKISYSSRQRRLAAFLLRDWVFSQDQRSQKRAIGLVLEGVGLRNPINSRRRLASVAADEMILPAGCGRDELVERCFGALKQRPSVDVARELAQILVSNAGADVIDGIWITEFSKTKDVDRWLVYGLHLRALSRANDGLLLAKLSEGKPSDSELKTLLLAGKYGLIEEVEEFSKQVMEGMLDGTYVRQLKSEGSIIAGLAAATNPSRYARGFQTNAPVSFREALSRNETEQPELPKVAGGRILNKTLSDCYEFLRAVDKTLDVHLSAWASDLAPWRAIVEKGRSLWGERYVFYQMANFASGINSKDDDYSKFADLLDCSKSLCDRLRYARFRSGNISWWKEQFGESSTSSENLLVILTFSTWASARTMLKLVDTYEEKN